MILLVDNYDSFSYNLYQLIGSLAPNVLVIRNDERTVAEMIAMKPRAVILSPGPGRPENAGVCVRASREVGEAGIPLLGVCLGHQAICQAFGGTVSYAKELMHGKQSLVQVDHDCLLFNGLPDEIPAARYHSLAALENSLPSELKVTGRTADGEVMAVQHTQHPIFGVQFHPESILTPDGKTMMKNFLRQVKLA